jgi:hypothetical protein
MNKVDKIGKRLTVKDDGVVKTLLLRHSRVGRNPERTEMTRSKSALISRLRGNDDKLAKCSFYDTIKDVSKILKIDARTYTLLRNGGEKCNPHGHTKTMRSKKA